MSRIRYGRTVHPGGRSIDLISDHQEWIDWAAEQLYKAENTKCFKTVGEALNHAYPWGYRSEDKEP